MNLTIADVTRMSLDAYVATKRGLCEIEHGPVDLMSQVQAVYTDGHVNIALTESNDLIPQTVLVLRGGGELAYITALGDVFREGHAPGAPVAKRGELGKRFASGDLTVGEALLATTMNVSDASMHSLAVRYRYGDDGLPVFDEIEDVRVVHGSHVSRMLRVACGHAP